jgi:hypothetical protein
MAARDPVREPEHLERLWLLPSDTTPIERLLAPNRSPAGRGSL